MALDCPLASGQGLFSKPVLPVARALLRPGLCAPGTLSALALLPMSCALPAVTSGYRSRSRDRAQAPKPTLLRSAMEPREREEPLYQGRARLTLGVLPTDANPSSQLMQFSAKMHPYERGTLCPEFAPLRQTNDEPMTQAHVLPIARVCERGATICPRDIAQTVPVVINQ